MRAIVFDTDCASAGHGVFGADESQAEICPERKRRYAILKQNLGKWRPRFLLCYMAPSTDTRHGG